MLTGDDGSKSTNHELLKRVRVAYENRLRELRDKLEQTSDSRCCQNNTVDKNSTLSEKRLDVLLRNLNDLKKEMQSSCRLFHVRKSLVVVSKTNDSDHIGWYKNLSHQVFCHNCIKLLIDFQKFVTDVLTHSTIGLVMVKDHITPQTLRCTIL